MSPRKTAVVFVAIAALTASLYAATSGSAAVVRTWNCAIAPLTADQGVLIRVSGAKLLVATGDPSAPQKFVALSSTEKGYTVGSRCHASTRNVVMSLNRLTKSTHASAIDCAAPAHVLIRLVLKSDADGFPASAKVEITQPHAIFKPLAQVQWSSGQPPLTYYGVACST